MKQYVITTHTGKMWLDTIAATQGNQVQFARDRREVVQSKSWWTNTGRSVFTRELWPGLVSTAEPLNKRTRALLEEYESLEDRGARLLRVCKAISALTRHTITEEQLTAMEKVVERFADKASNRGRGSQHRVVAIEASKSHDGGSAPEQPRLRVPHRGRAPARSKRRASDPH